MLSRLSLAGLLALGFAYATASTSDARTATSESKPTADAASEAPNCGSEIANLGALADVPMILLGELHGLEAVPAFAIHLACRLAATGKPVLLALEIPRQEQDRIDAFLASK